MLKIKKQIRQKRKGPWTVYILQCADNTFYTGITNNPERRLKEHNSGRGSKYIIPLRRPAVIVYTEKKKTITTAMRREREIKKYTRKKKAELIGKF